MYNLIIAAAAPLCTGGLEKDNYTCRDLDFRTSKTSNLVHKLIN